MVYSGNQGTITFSLSENMRPAKADVQFKFDVIRVLVLVLEYVSFGNVPCRKCLVAVLDTSRFLWANLAD
jgi:hypothetical protein